MGEWDAKKRALDALRRPGRKPGAAFVVSPPIEKMYPIKRMRTRRKKELTAVQKSRREAIKSLRALVRWSKKQLAQATFRYQQHQRALVILEHGLPKEVLRAQAKGRESRDATGDGGLACHDHRD